MIAVGVFVSAQPREAFAQTGGSFSWRMYKGDDNNQHTYPRWVAIKGQQGKVNFDIAGGQVGVPTGWTPTKAMCKVYRPSEIQKGEYETTPFLIMETATFIVVEGTAIMTWGDTNDPKKVFDSGITVQMAIIITYKNNANPNVTMDVGQGTTYSDTTPF